MAMYIGNQKVCPVVKVGTIPTGTLSITANGVYDVTNYASADVSVSGGGSDTVACIVVDRDELKSYSLLLGNVSTYDSSLEVPEIVYSRVGGYIGYWQITPNTDYSLFYWETYTGYLRDQTVNTNSDIIINYLGGSND